MLGQTFSLLMGENGPSIKHVVIVTNILLNMECEEVFLTADLEQAMSQYMLTDRSGLLQTLEVNI